MEAPELLLGKVAWAAPRQRRRGLPKRYDYCNVRYIDALADVRENARTRTSNDMLDFKPLCLRSCPTS